MRAALFAAAYEASGMAGRFTFPRLDAFSTEFLAAAGPHARFAAFVHGLRVAIWDRAVEYACEAPPKSCGRGYVREAMTNAKRRRALVAAILGALLVLLVVIPVVISLASGDGAICFAAAACPLSAINPCVRKPSFALVGRCAIAIR